MDNFMDKIAQKLNSQDMIRANAAADAAELETLETQMAMFKEQMQKYDDCLQEMRKLNLKNIESAQGVRHLADQANEKFGKTMEEMESATVSKIQEASDLSLAGIRQTSDVSIEGIRQTSDASIAGIHQTVEESLAKIAEIRENTANLEAITETMTGVQDKLEQSFKSLEDFLHTDNVKVYRNVQASMIEELEKQTAQLRESQEKNSRNIRLLLPFAVITMIFSLATLGIMIARVLGLF